MNCCLGSNKSVFGTAVAVGLLTVLVTVPPSLLAQRDDDDSLVYPPDSSVYGMTYGDWAVAYWQYPSLDSAEH